MEKLWKIIIINILSTQFSSFAQLCPTLRPHEMQHTKPPCPSPTPRVYSKLMSIESVMPSNHLILCRPLLPPSTFPSIRGFSNESILHIRWPKYWSFSLSICPSSENSGLISFKIDCDLLERQGTLKSLLQHHRSKASIQYSLGNRIKNSWVWHMTVLMLKKQSKLKEHYLSFRMNNYSFAKIKI